MKSKLLGLEVLRFIAAFAVLIWHYQHFSFINYIQVDFVRENQPFYSVLKLFYEYGLVGVEVFWCISGYIFFWKYREPLLRKIVSGRKFFILRFSRLYPLHLLTLLLVAVLQFLYWRTNGFYFVYANNGFDKFVSHLFLANYWAPNSPYSFNGPIWSISIEVLVYVLFFLQFRFLKRPELYTVLFISTWFLAKFFEISHPIFDCLFFFYAGGAVALLRASIRQLAWIALIALPLAAWIFDLFLLPYFYTGFVLFYFPLLVFCAAAPWSGSEALNTKIETIGNMTYASYLIHFPLQVAISLVCSNLAFEIPYREPWFFIFYFALIFALSIFLYRFFEMPMQNWIRRRPLV